MNLSISFTDDVFEKIITNLKISEHLFPLQGAIFSLSFSPLFLPLYPVSKSCSSLFFLLTYLSFLKNTSSITNMLDFRRRPKTFPSPQCLFVTPKKRKRDTRLASLSTSCSEVLTLSKTRPDEPLLENAKLSPLSTQREASWYLILQNWKGTSLSFCSLWQENSPGLEFVSVLAGLPSWASDSFPLECADTSNGVERLGGD